ncbi:phosphate--AMP phosphotransferase, partial [candidate division KSB1 bacterium]|nr:phosphate--AMP phosphotransferase [candidate division KSB1 bacterium]
IFDRSWYGRVLTERVDRIVPKRIWSHAFDEIKSFERQLVDQGAVVLKFFLHISKKEQKKRFQKIEKIPAQSWKVTKQDWKHHKQYESYFEAAEEMLARTDSEYAPWTLVASEDRRFATVQIFKTFVSAVGAKLATAEKPQPPASVVRTERIGSSVLDRVDLSKTLTRDAYSTKLKTLQERMRDLEHTIYLQRIPVIIVFEGWDAAGKGGDIKRLTAPMDPRGFEVVPIGAPNDIEKAHHYLWRFWSKIPKGGHICIFDRSWYGRVMVERVEGFCTEEEWKRAYREINEMEEQWCFFGAAVIKFWLHIDKEEQMRRFEERKQVPYKQWKITDEDWRNREKWGAYKEAVDEMLFRTSTNHAPWTIVESDCKLYGRIKVLQTVIKGIENKLK